jgi:hypothetical protein
MLASHTLSHTSKPFCSGYFGDRILLLPQASLDLSFCYAFRGSWEDRREPLWGSLELFLPGLAWNHGPPVFSLLFSLGWQEYNTVCFQVDLDGVLMKYFPWLASNHHLPHLSHQVARITGVSHQHPA